MGCLSCCYSSSESLPPNAPPEHSCVMQPIAGKIIEWENSDYCAVRVLAYAIKFFGSFILIATFVGIYPWICVHEEYLLQTLEGRVHLLPPPAEPGQAGAPDARDEEIVTLKAQLQRAEGDLEFNKLNQAKVQAIAAKENQSVIDLIYKKHETALAQAREEVQKAGGGNIQAAEDKIRELGAQLTALQQANEELHRQLPPSQDTLASLADGWNPQTPKANAQPGATSRPGTPFHKGERPPTYDELKAENESLRKQLANLNAQIATDGAPNTDSLRFDPHSPSNALRGPPLNPATDDDAMNSSSGENSRNGSSSGPAVQPSQPKTDTVKMSRDEIKKS